MVLKVNWWFIMLFVMETIQISVMVSVGAVVAFPSPYEFDSIASFFRTCVITVSRIEGPWSAFYFRMDERKRVLLLAFILSSTILELCELLRILTIFLLHPLLLCAFWVSIKFHLQDLPWKACGNCSVWPRSRRLISDDVSLTSLCSVGFELQWFKPQLV